MSDDLTTSLAAAATLMTATTRETQQEPQLSSTLDTSQLSSDEKEESFMKTNVRKLKTSNETGKIELQGLNEKLSAFIERARFLEGQNQKLIKKVDEVKAKRLPKSDNLGDLVGDLNRARIELEDESKACVLYEVNTEKNKNRKEDYANRMKFYLKEEDAIRQKIASLTNELENINHERDYIKRSSQQVLDNIESEKESMAKADEKLENLREALAEQRYKNKCIEFELQTLEDERQFLRAVNEEELNALKKFLKATPTNADFHQFYRSELNSAVKDIQVDFKRLLNQQMNELREQKEAELNYYREQEQRKEEALKTRRAQSLEREVDDIQFSKLPDTIEQSRKDLKELKAQYVELTQILANLEDKLKAIKETNAVEIRKRDDIINDLRLDNETFLNDLEYLDRITKTRLESEIQAYKSILNSQYKFLMSDDRRGSNTVESRPSSIVVVEEPTRQVDNSSTSILIDSSLSSGKSEKSSHRPSSVTIVEDKTSEPTSIIVGSTVQVIEETVPSYPNHDPIEDELYKAFKKFDKDNSGYVTTQEIHSLLTSLGYSFSLSQISRLVSTVDKNNDGRLTFEEFKRLLTDSTERKSTVSVLETSNTSEEAVEAVVVQQETPHRNVLRKIFDSIDTDASGFINSKEFINIFEKMDLQVTENQFRELLANADIDNDRNIDFDEFCHIMEPTMRGEFKDDDLLNAFRAFDKVISSICL